jgi:hypothetical protein
MSKFIAGLSGQSGRGSGGFVAPDRNDNRRRLLSRLRIGEEVPHQPGCGIEDNQRVLVLLGELSSKLDGVVKNPQVAAEIWCKENDLEGVAWAHRLIATTDCD